MPQQLIYTSAPRGLVAGRSGYCTVARSVSMREPLMLQLERFSYYQHLSLSGGRERPIFTFRIVDIRGSRFHVLSRIQDARLDFTGRTNFIAHHLVFTPEEIRQNATPPVILRNWTSWATSWTKEPQMLENENWPELAALASGTNVPAQTWQRVTGDAINGYGLLEARAGASFSVDGLTDEDVLSLLAESLELLEVRDARRDFRATSWNYTFTTSMQEQDNPADFRWRCFQSNNPAVNKFAAPDSRLLSAVRAMKWTDEEIAFARTGRQPPRFIVHPADVRIIEGEAVRFTAQAEGIPMPVYQWFSVDRADNGQILPGKISPELVVSNPVLGKSRYIVSATNSAGTTQSSVATLSVEQKVKLVARADAGLCGLPKPALYSVKTAEDIQRDRERHRIKKEEEINHKRLQRNRILAATGVTVVVLTTGGFLLKTRHLWPFKAGATVSTTNFPGNTPEPAVVNNSNQATVIVAKDAPTQRETNHSATTTATKPDVLYQPSYTNLVQGNKVTNQQTSMSKKGTNAP
jgi:hypothetical protein